MIAFFARYKLVLEIAVIGALALAVLVGVHSFLDYEQGIGEARVQARWDAQKVADERAAIRLEKDWRERYDAAINQGAINEKIARTAAATANASNDSLRNTSTGLLKLIPNASADTARAYAGAYAAVFADCVGRYKAMGETAQGHLNDDQAVRDAWPGAGPPQLGQQAAK